MKGLGHPCHATGTVSDVLPRSECKEKPITPGSSFCHWQTICPTQQKSFLRDFVFLSMWQVWRDLAGPWPSTQAVTNSHRLNEVLTELCASGNVVGHTNLPLASPGPLLPIPNTLPGLCVTTPTTGPELTERSHFCITKNYSLYECFHLLSWKNNLGSNRMYQDKKLLDIESESHFRTSACFLTTGWNSRVVLSMHIPEIKTSEGS